MQHPGSKRSEKRAPRLIQVGDRSGGNAQASELRMHIFIVRDLSLTWPENAHSSFTISNRDDKEAVLIEVRHDKSTC